MKLLIWTRFTNSLFKTDPETRATKAGETRHMQQRRTLSAVLFPTDRPCVFAFGAAADPVSRTHISGFWSWIFWHQRLGTAAAGNLRYPVLSAPRVRDYLPLYAGNQAFVRMNATRAGFILGAAIHRNASIWATNRRLHERLRLLTETLQVCRCAREACVVSTWAQRGCGWNEALNCRCDSNSLD